MAAALVVGAAMLWVSLVGARLRARRAESAVRALEAQVADLKTRLTAAKAVAASATAPSNPVARQLTLAQAA